MKTEVEVQLDAGDYLRARGTPVTPAKVESYVRERLAQNGQVLPGASVPEIVTAVNALTEQSTHERQTTMKTKREFLTPRSPDGKSGGEVVTANVQSEPNRVTQYAEPQPYFTNNVDRTPLSSQPPATQAEADALEAQRFDLCGQIERGTLDAEERATAAQRIQKIEELLARWRNSLMQDQGHREQVR